MEKFDILFLGRLFPKAEEFEIKRKMKTGMADAANALQWSIIDGMEKNSCGKLTILNYLPVNSFPNGYDDFYIKEFNFQHKQGLKTDVNVGHCNLSIVKQITNIIPYCYKVRKWVNDGEKRRKVLFLYSAQPLSLELARFVKHLNNQIETVCLIADIPEYNTIGELTGIRKAFNDYETRKTNALYRYIDKFVLLTEQMAQRLDIHVPYTVMEGIAPESDTETDETFVKQFSDEKFVLYTGTLNYEFGIGILLEAFSKIPNQDLKLVICGFGEAEKAILVSRDTRLVYMGKFDRKQALALQQCATVLVNPRQNNNEFTKYSFPSKTMEYLASGVPVVAYKLDGIPDEYDKYLNYVPDDTPESLAEKIIEICSMPDSGRKEAGKRAKQFVLNEKNSLVQAKRILELIDN